VGRVQRDHGGEPGCADRALTRGHVQHHQGPPMIPIRAPAMLACACMSFVHHYAPAKAALVWAGSDGGGRAALVVRPYEGRA
jgi:hypothetical protein